MFCVKGERRRRGKTQSRSSYYLAEKSVRSYQFGVAKVIWDNIGNAWDNRKKYEDVSCFHGEVKQVSTKESCTFSMLSLSRVQDGDDDDELSTPLKKDPGVSKHTHDSGRENVNTSTSPVTVCCQKLNFMAQ